MANAFKSWVFVMNLYDPCVWNKIYFLKQTTIMFHTCYLITSHESSSIVTKHVKSLDEACGAKYDLTVTRRKTHECLGMKIYFSVKRDVAMTQYGFVKKLWTNLPPGLKVKYRSTSAPDSLFKVNKDAPPLNHTRKVMFHANAAKMLWIS